ncbi:MAG: DUF4139 domain-containing protein [Chloroflexota bacterium]
MLARLFRRATILGLVSILAVLTFLVQCDWGLSRVKAQEEGVQLTVYNQNLALVKDRRTLSLKKGDNEIKFTDVAAQIDPTSVSFEALKEPQAASVLEQNFEYDLVSTAKLLQKYLDQKISVITKDGTAYEGYLQSTAQDIILASEKEGGQVTVIKADQIREIKYPRLPSGLITKPTLVWKLTSTKEGPQLAEVTYLTGGVNWVANYVAVADKDDKNVALTGWVTIDNKSGTGYENARLQLIAGDIHRVTPPAQAWDMAEAKRAVPTPAPAGFAEQPFFEYHLYTLQRPTTIKNNQTKQIEFVTAPQVPVNKIYVYDGAQLGRIGYYGSPLLDKGYGTAINKKVVVMLELKNAKDKGLGIPLPKGTVRVYKKDDQGGSQLIGEDAIDHTPKDEKMMLYLGDAFDIVGERKQTDFKRISDRVYEESFEIKVRNHKDAPVEVRVVEHLYRWSDWEIVKTSTDYVKTDSRTIEYRLPVGKDGEATVTYTVRYKW